MIPTRLPTLVILPKDTPMRPSVNRVVLVSCVLLLASCDKVSDPVGSIDDQNESTNKAPVQVDTTPSSSSQDPTVQPVVDAKPPEVVSATTTDATNTVEDITVEDIAVEDNTTVKDDSDAIKATEAAGGSIKRGKDGFVSEVSFRGTTIDDGVDRLSRSSAS